MVITPLRLLFEPPLLYSTRACSLNFNILSGIFIFLLWLTAKLNNPFMLPIFLGKDSSFRIPNNFNFPNFFNLVTLSGKLVRSSLYDKSNSLSSCNTRIPFNTFGSRIRLPRRLKYVNFGKLRKNPSGNLVMCKPSNVKLSKFSAFDISLRRLSTLSSLTNAFGCSASICNFLRTNGSEIL